MESSLLSLFQPKECPRLDDRICGPLLASDPVSLAFFNIVQMCSPAFKSLYAGLTRTFPQKGLFMPLNIQVKQFLAHLSLTHSHT